MDALEADAEFGNTVASIPDATLGEGIDMASIIIVSGYLKAAFIYRCIYIC